MTFAGDSARGGYFEAPMTSRCSGHRYFEVSRLAFQTSKSTPQPGFSVQGAGAALKPCLRGVRALKSLPFSGVDASLRLQTTTNQRRRRGCSLGITCRIRYLELEMPWSWVFHDAFSTSFAAMCHPSAGPNGRLIFSLGQRLGCMAPS